jgi:NAD(P) transhydrogenase subunit alpha
MIIGILPEPTFETRVSMLPEAVAALTKKGHQVLVATGAGDKASAFDADYTNVGAQVLSTTEIIHKGELLFSINIPENVASIPSLKILVGVYQPLFNAAKMKECADKGQIIFSLDMLPRTTRAQSMDVLSSQANIAGYKAVLLAANLYPRYFPMFMTAAGSIAPAKLLILGAGVAGLQAIATARRLGAVVEVFDTRPAVKEEVISLGARFIEVEGAADASKAGGYAVEQSEEFMQLQKQKIADSCAKADIVITTAQIPGKKAPVLITTAMIEGMRKGSLIIDLAAATGGNTELTKNDETVVHKGVHIVGNSALATSMPSDASKMYGKNCSNFLQLLNGREGELQPNWDDELVKGCCITRDGKVVHERVVALMG